MKEMQCPNSLPHSECNLAEHVKCIGAVPHKERCSCNPVVVFSGNSICPPCIEIPPKRVQAEIAVIVNYHVDQYTEKVLKEIEGGNRK